MEAKDTVMSEEEIKDFMLIAPLVKWARTGEIEKEFQEIMRCAGRVASNQAEISFKAGYEDAVKHLHDPEVLAIADEALKEERLAGIRGVVEWLEEQSTDEVNGKLYVFVEADLQAKLKELGVGQ